MPKVNANGVAINYEQQGSGEPLVLIPYLAADNACYAFQVGEYAKHFTCFSLDLRGTGASDKPDGEYSTELFADDVAAFIQAAGITRAHVAGLSLGAGVAMWLGVKHPERVLSLSLHGGWTKSDPFLQTVVESWQVLAKALGRFPRRRFAASSRGASRRSYTLRNPNTSSLSPISSAAGRHSPSRRSCSTRMRFWPTTSTGSIGSRRRP